MQRTTGKQRHSARIAKSWFVAPRTAAEFFALPEDLQDRWIRVANVVSKVRADGVSLARASREFELDPRMVVRLGGSALRKRANGRYAAKPSDRLLRVLVVLTPDGPQEIALRDSPQASQVAEHWDAVQRHLQKGDDSALPRFRSVRITDVNDVQVRLLTDVEEIDRFGSGVLSFESLYARTAFCPAHRCGQAMRLRRNPTRSSDIGE